ncbi:hypothetical protein ACL6C3_02545 [Capilliphycus salinus ALCB114379]|uniref:hypothetical protein n=1 Tax=Capilliphycus salinus TaxID=2768948 RepID=UPI0039A44EDA
MTDIPSGSGAGSSPEQNPQASILEVNYPIDVAVKRYIGDGVACAFGLRISPRTRPSIGSSTHPKQWETEFLETLFRFLAT